MPVRLSDAVSLGALSTLRSPQLATGSVGTPSNSIDDSTSSATRADDSSAGCCTGDEGSSQRTTSQVTPGAVTKICAARVSATSTTVTSSSVSFDPSNSINLPVNSTAVYDSLQPALDVSVDIDENAGNLTKGENCASSSSPQCAANSVILPTLIEAPGATPTQVLIPVPDTRSGNDQQPLSQQLSFPNVSVFGQSTVPVCSSSNDDPLRTPPRPFIEHHTSKTDSNIGPAAPSTVPPPVVVVQPIDTPSTCCINSSTSTSSPASSSSLSDAHHHHHQHHQHQHSQQQSKRPTAIRKSIVTSPYTPTSIPVSVVTSVRSSGLTCNLASDGASTSATSAPAIPQTLSPADVQLNADNISGTPSAPHPSLSSDGHLNNRILIHRSLTDHHQSAGSASAPVNSSVDSTGGAGGTINSGRASTIVSSSVSSVSSLAVNGHSSGDLVTLPLLPGDTSSLVPQEPPPPQPQSQVSHMTSQARPHNIINGISRLTGANNGRIMMRGGSLPVMVPPVMSSGNSTSNGSQSILTPCISNEQSIAPAAPVSVSTTLKPPPLNSGNPTKPFKCPICEKNLASKNVYQLHLRSHSGEKPFVCNVCRNAFSQKTSLTRHMRSHTGERPYPCEICSKRFADKERIKIHLRTHTGEKPFACSICHKTFSQKSTVKRHMSVHTGEKPFQCSHCGKGFANRGNLTAHEKTHSHKGDKIFY